MASRGQDEESRGAGKANPPTVVSKWQTNVGVRGRRASAAVEEKRQGISSAGTVGVVEWNQLFELDISNFDPLEDRFVMSVQIIEKKATLGRFVNWRSLCFD